MGYKKGAVLRTAFDSYTIQTQIGAGWTGEVYQVVDSDGIARAAKVLETARGTFAGLKQSRDEFNYCFRATHKNIIPVLDCGLTGSKAAFYVMPLYACSLRGLILQGIPPQNVLRIFGGILDGIEAAHLHNIWHHDLKPENILANQDGKELVISDFGVARFAAEALFAAVSTSQPPVQFPYAAPEQKNREATINGKADVYALGMMLHEMFTGKTSIGAGHSDVADVAPDFAYLDWTVGRMTHPEPARRPAITEVKRELIARGNEFLSIQRLSALKNDVILETDVDDPLIHNQITIQGVDFKGETLYLTLSVAPPPNWVMAFHGLAPNSGSSGHGPERFVFLGRMAHLRVARNYEPQQLLDSAKAYVEMANRQYVEWAIATHRHNLEQERKKRHALIAAEERRRDVLSRLRL